MFKDSPIAGTKYSLIGVGASAIYRIDATYAKRFTFFMAGTLHHLQTFDQASNKGEYPSRSVGSVSFTAGVGVNLGTR